MTTTQIEIAFSYPHCLLKGISKNSMHNGTPEIKSLEKCFSDLFIGYSQTDHGNWKAQNFMGWWIFEWCGG